MKDSTWRSTFRAGLGVTAVAISSVLAQAQPAPCCPLSQGHYKNDPATPACVANILKAPTKGSAAAILIQQWIASVYNFATCSPSEELLGDDKFAELMGAILNDAPSLLQIPPLAFPYDLPDLCGYTVPKVKSSSETGKEMLALAGLLGDYNNGYYNDCDGDGVTPYGGDCNDSDPAIYPGAAEVVDGKDNDCDGEVDEDSCPCPYPGIPNPVIEYDAVNGWEPAEIGYRFNLNVTNSELFPDCIFASTGEPTCSSRTWVDIYDASTDSYIYGFCVFGQASDLDLIWVPVADLGNPPSVYIVMTDRKCVQKYTSNVIQLPAVD